MLKRLLMVTALLLLASTSYAATCDTAESSITVYPELADGGITFTFDTTYECGTFANGDYWVKGSPHVTITAMTPAASNGLNGWEVNPTVQNYQGFGDNCRYYHAELMPSLPYTSVLPIESIVKVRSLGTNPDVLIYPCTKTAAVLTIVTDTPADDGATVFRPPYVGTTKPMYSTKTVSNGGDLRDDLLPSFAPVGSPPSLATVEGYFKYFRLEHVTSTALRDLRASDAFYDYQPKNSQKNHDMLMRLMLNDSFADKLPALVKYVQHGIDRCYCVLAGWDMGSDASGHNPGHRVIAAFAATMLDLTDVKAMLNSLDDFHEDHFLQESLLYPTTTALYGDTDYVTETRYWSWLRGTDGITAKSQYDPYGYIDGGNCGADYQLIISQSWKASMLATYLMPVLKNAWNIPKWLKLRLYVDRWVNTGVWAQPDPCAPVAGTYGVDYGPDPSNPGMCILDEDVENYVSPTDWNCEAGGTCGRFPEKHDTNADGPTTGVYVGTEFIGAMWDAYADYAEEPDTDPPVITIVSPTGGPLTCTADPVRTSTVLTLTTVDDGSVTCHCESSATATNATAYVDLGIVMDGAGTTTHTTTIADLPCDASYQYFVRCVDDADIPNETNAPSPSWSFDISDAEDIVAPTLGSQVIGADGTTLTLTFSEAVEFGQGGADDFTITPSGGAATVAYSSGGFSTVLTYLISRTISVGETVTLDYTSATDRVEDSAGNDLATITARAVTNSSAVPAVASETLSYSLWDDDTIATTNYSGTIAVEMGVKFQVLETGDIIGIRFYKSAVNTGTHIGNLWTEAGVQLATVTFTDETASGWQQQLFASPVRVTPGNTYVASYFCPTGKYTQYSNYFLSSSYTNGSLVAQQSVAGDLNGPYAQSAESTFPYIGSTGNRNYWVDPLFAPLRAVMRPGCTISGGGSAR